MSVRSAFCPSQDSDLVLRHMQSHYRRVVEAKAKVDTSVPRSLLNGIKVKKKTRRESSKRLVSSSFTENDKKVFEREKQKHLSQSVSFSQQHDSSVAKSIVNSHRLSCQNPAPSAVDGITTVSESTGRLHEEDRSMSVESSARLDKGGVRYFDLLELSSDLQEQHTGKWQLYHTPTGRLTRYLQEKQMHSSAQPEKTKPPWKPSLHASSPIPKSVGVEPQESLHNHKPISNSDLANCTTTQHPPENQTSFHGLPQEGSSCWRTGNSINRTTQNSSELDRSAEYISSQRSPHTGNRVCVSGSAVTDNRPTSQKEDPLPLSSEDNSNIADSRLCYYKVREFLTEGAEMKLKSQAVVRRVAETRQNYKDRMLECRYLQFESEVTWDILSRGILSEPALELLFRMHIDRHKHQLREDELVRRSEVLKRLIIGV